jgi:hypothetical protein
MWLGKFMIWWGVILTLLLIGVHMWRWVLGG